MYITKNSRLTGAIENDETHAGNGEAVVMQMSPSIKIALGLLQEIVH